MVDFRPRHPADARRHLVGAIPGPGGIFVFAAGLALVLKTSMWAKRRYVALQALAAEGRALDRLGPAAPSARRREAIRKEREERLPAPERGDGRCAATEARRQMRPSGRPRRLTLPPSPTIGARNNGRPLAALFH